ncbi:MAG: response regulator [Halobacteriovoraceae bacterium]|nr:response regulator [Halobacteriovoraceae bacterium]
MMSKQATFLIIDDQHVVRNAVKSQLKEIGFTGEFHTAEDGKLGLEYLQSNKKIDFIICDIVMPNMSGLELLKEVRQIQEYKDTPFLMLTAESEIKIVMDAIVAGASNYLVKPWSLEDLKNKIALCWKKHHGEKK